MPESGGLSETVLDAAKLARLTAMTEQLLEELRCLPLDSCGRHRLVDLLWRDLAEVGSVLSDDLIDELDRLLGAVRRGTDPTEGELRIVQAQLVGWLKGLQLELTDGTSNDVEDSSEA